MALGNNQTQKVTIWLKGKKEPEIYDAINFSIGTFFVWINLKDRRIWINANEIKRIEVGA